MPQRPIPNTYWVEPGRLLAGEYPGDVSPENANRKIRALAEAGFSRFIDLTHPDDRLKPYASVLEELRGNVDAALQRLHHPITDMSVPKHPDEMTAILDAIDAGLEQGEKVYVHCWGGIGRTGTVVGCYLVRRGLSGDEALERVQELWTTSEKYPIYPRSPQAKAQFDFVRSWEEWDR